jgi:hypothetical protein
MASDSRASDPVPVRNSRPANGSALVLDEASRVAVRTK